MSVLQIVDISKKIAKPDWLKISPPKHPERYEHIKGTLRKYNLHTVCEEAHCPNMSECWGSEHGTATFMVMGDVCTRGCKFCAIKTNGKGRELDIHEPENLAKAVAEWGLEYVVITMVTRDDLKDGGASHLAEVVKQLKKEHPNVLVELLTSDFKGKIDSVKAVVDSSPDVFAHNVETVERLQHPVRDPRANFNQSLAVLKAAKEMNPNVFTKTALMLGLGETEDEIIDAMHAARENSVDILTLGQYMRPSDWHLPVVEWVSPEKFKRLEEIGKKLGFRYVAAGPFVRSSYKAGEFFVKNLVQGRHA